MSHTVKIKTQFKQIGPLKDAFRAMGWTIKEKSKIRTYPGDPKSNEVYDFVAVNPDKNASYAYDVGINESGEELSVHCDFFGGSIAKTLGSDLIKLKDEYACQVIEQKYAYEGAAVFRTTNSDGTIDLDVQFPS
ncbi:MAG: hypothetical protein EBU46_16440 [Nitrosomonadaceae bacterium]|nr:hypothetical protein [Nitrosomonadaceae bacterium]